MAIVDKTKVLTDEDIDLLLEDWYGRGETFTAIRKKGRLGWEKTLGEDSPYSEYFLEAPTDKELIKRAYSLARDTIVVMDPPFKVRISIRPKSSESCTDGKTVYVATNMFDDKEMTVGERLDVFLGCTIHEGCHLLYTDMKWCAKITSKVIFTLWNIIEDERIEQLCGKLKPGLAQFLEKTKLWIFDAYYLDYEVPAKEKLEKEGKYNDFLRLMGVFMRLVRFPKYIDEDEVVYFGHHLLAIRDVLVPMPKTTEDSVRAAYRVFDIMKEFYTEKELERRTAEGEDTSFEAVEKAAEGSMEKDSAEIIEELSKRISAPRTSVSAPSSVERYGDTDLSSKDVSSEVKKDGGLLGELCEGEVELGDKKDSFFKKMPDNQRIYMESLERVKRFVPAIAKVLKGNCKEYKLIHKSMRSGVLDTNKLAEAFQGVSTVYMREGKVSTDKVAVCVLIDESGSMSGPRIQAARDTAVLVNEALGHIPNVELFIYGHSGDMRYSQATEMFVYREKGYAPKFALGSVTARSQNRDGIAIYETAQRVRKQTKNPVLFFILSDGAPAANGYGGASAMEHVRKNVQFAEKMGFNVIQVCINHSYDPKKMFRNFVIMEDMSKLATDLGKAIKRATLNVSVQRVE